MGGKLSASTPALPLFVLLVLAEGDEDDDEPREEAAGNFPFFLVVMIPCCKLRLRLGFNFCFGDLRGCCGC